MKKTLTLLLAFTVVACGDDTSPMTGTDGGINLDGGAQRRGAANPPSIATLSQIDRMGRAAINTALIETFNSSDSVKDGAKNAYNAASPAAWPNYEDEMMASLAILDSLDTVCGNQFVADNASPRYGFLAQVLADDQIYVNSDSGTCGTYLGLEAEVVGAISVGDGGCGGRTPSDDVIERTYSLLAAGALSGVDDTITANDVAFSATFPFLAP